MYQNTGYWWLARKKIGFEISVRLKVRYLERCLFMEKKVFWKAGIFLVGLDKRSEC